MKLLVAVYTHAEIAEETVAVRIISVRRLAKRETRQYEEGPV